MTSPTVSVVVNMATARALVVTNAMAGAVVVANPNPAAVVSVPGLRGPVGVGVLLLEPGAVVPPGTPAGTVIFEKAG